MSLLNMSVKFIILKFSSQHSKLNNLTRSSLRKSTLILSIHLILFTNLAFILFFSCFNCSRFKTKFSEYRENLNQLIRKNYLYYRVHKFMYMKFEYFLLHFFVNYIKACCCSKSLYKTIRVDNFVLSSKM